MEVSEHQTDVQHGRLVEVVRSVSAIKEVSNCHFPSLFPPETKAVTNVG